MYPVRGRRVGAPRVRQNGRYNEAQTADEQGAATGDHRNMILDLSGALSSSRKLPGFRSPLTTSSSDRSPSELIPRIFELFYTLDETHTVMALRLARVSSFAGLLWLVGCAASPPQPSALPVTSAPAP